MCKIEHLIYGILLLVVFLLLKYFIRGENIVDYTRSKLPTNLFLRVSCLGPDELRNSDRRMNLILNGTSFRRYLSRSNFVKVVFFYKNGLFLGRERLSNFLKLFGVSIASIVLELILRLMHCPFLKGKVLKFGLIFRSIT